MRSPRLTAGICLAGCLGAGSLAAGAPPPGGIASTPAVPAVTHAEAPPPAHTGGFGEPTCLECHFDFDLNLDGHVRVEGLPPEAEPGRRYVLTVVLTSSEMALAGFQLSTRDAGGSQAGALVPLDPGVRVTELEGVAYAHQTLAGSEAADAERTSWSLEWRAPAASGEVRVHVAANSANGDNSPFGDLIYADSVVVRVTKRLPDWR